MKLIDKDALVSEIERLIELFTIPQYSCEYNDAKADGFREFLSFIDTIEVKEVDLEKEIQAFAKIELEPIKIYDANVSITITMHQLYQCAKHFFELGLKGAQKGE